MLTRDTENIKKKTQTKLLKMKITMSEKDQTLQKQKLVNLKTQQANYPKWDIEKKV